MRAIVTGKASGLFVVETDSEAHGDGIDGEAALKKIVEQFGEWPLTRQAVSPSGSRHYYFRWPANGFVVRNSTSKLGKGIDVRGEGGMVVAPPSRRGEGQYRWANSEPIDFAPQWLLDLIAHEERLRYSSEYDGEAEIVHPAFVAETVKYVPTELEWNERNRVGMAIFACTRGSDDGFEIWDEWLRRSGRYREGASRKRWRDLHRCPPDSIGFGFLFNAAVRARPSWLDKLDRQFLAMNHNNVDDFLKNHFAQT